MPEDHGKQLERIANELEAFAKQKGLIGFLTGVNLVLIFIEVLLLIAALIAFLAALAAAPETGGASLALPAILAALAIIVVLVHIILKFIEEDITTGNDENIQRIKREVDRKKAELEEEKKKHQ